MKHTPGPWNWRQSSSGRIDLAAPHGGGTVVMDFVRLGMNAAQPRFALCDDGQPRGKRGGILHNATSLIADHPDKLLDHPDAHLIAAAPDLLAALEAARYSSAIGWEEDAWITQADAALAKAKGAA